MTALAKTGQESAQSKTGEDPGWGTMRLSGLLAATADRHPQRLCLSDQPGRDTWSGRPQIQWSYSVAHDIVQRLAAFFASLGLPARASIGIALPASSEAGLAVLAIDQAGLTPCLLPVSWNEEDLAQAVEVANVQAVITQGAIGEERPADLFCRLAARYFGLRFVCAFGPQIPDGVVDLDRVILKGAPLGDGTPSQLQPDGETGLITFERSRPPLRPVQRSSQSLIASAVTLLVEAKIQAGERILTLLPPDDLAGLTTGLIASLLSGASLESHGLFDSRSFRSALESSVPTHIVAPGWMEEHLSRLKLRPSVQSVILVHQAPIRFRARMGLSCHVIDVLSFGERALMAGSRGLGGRFALQLDEEPANSSVESLLRIRRDEDGTLLFGGLAAQAGDFQRADPEPPAPATWRPSRFKADVFAGIVIGVREA